MKHLLDYSNEPNMTFSEVKRCWINKKREESGLEYQWSIKDQTLLSRMMKEYSSEDIVTMLEALLKVSPTTTFGGFFKVRESVYINTCKPKDYDWN